MAKEAVLLDQFVPGSNSFTWRHVLKPKQIYQSSPRNESSVLIDGKIKKNIIGLVVNILDPLYSQFGDGFGINSLYRDPAANAAAGGAKSSDHLNAAAADIDVKSALKKGSVKNRDLYFFIKNSVPSFKQLIWETKTGKGSAAEDGEPWWVHISYLEGSNKNEVFALNDGKKTDSTASKNPPKTSDVSPTTKGDGGNDGVDGGLGAEDDKEELPNYQKTFDQIGINISNTEQDQVNVSWGKRASVSEDCDWISLKQFILYLSSKYTPQSLLPFVEFIPQVTMDNGYYEKAGSVPKDTAASVGNKATSASNQLQERRKKMDEGLPKGSFYTDSKRAGQGQEATNSSSGVADLTSVDPFKESYDWMGVPNEAGLQVMNARKVGVRAFGQLVLSPGAMSKSTSKPGPIGFTDFEIKSGAQCDNGLAIISMSLVDVQGNKFTDLTSPWSFIYDARPGSSGGDYWFRYGWMLRLPYYDKANKTSMGFWTHPGWEVFGDEVRHFLINQILPSKPYITLTQSINSEISNTVDKNGNVLGSKEYYSLFDDGVQYNEVNGEVTVSRSNLTDANYVKLSILNPEVSQEDSGALTAKLSFRTTGSIVHQMPLAFAHYLRRVISESRNITLGDLLIAYLADLDAFSSFNDSDAERGKRQYVNGKRHWRNLANSRDFTGYVHVIGLGRGANQGDVHPDSVYIKISKKKASVLENKTPDNETTIIRWLREVLDDNGCALQSAATGSGAGINAAWIICVTDDFDESQYVATPIIQPTNSSLNSTDSKSKYANTLELMRQEKDVFAYRFQGSLSTKISIEKTDTPNAMKIDVDYTVGDFVTYTDYNTKIEQPPTTVADRQRNLKILFAQMQSAKIEAICHPWIGPGKNVFVKGMGFFDGEYMVLSATHKLGSDNFFITSLEAARILKDDNTKEEKKENLDNSQENGGGLNVSSPVSHQIKTSGK